jgi:hypothetical protein
LVTLGIGWAGVGASIAALLLLRLADGIFTEGKRGLNAGLIHVGYPAALVCVSLLTAFVLRLAPRGDADSAYAVWGWRIPFVIGALLGNEARGFQSVAAVHCAPIHLPAPE